MTRTATSIVLTLFLTGCAATNAPAAEAPASAPAPAQSAGVTQVSSIDQILDALDVRGDSLKDFTADVKLQEEDAAVGNVVVRTGKIWFQRLPNDDARMRLTLDKKQVKDKTIDEKLEYVYSQGWLTDRDYRRQLNVRRQMVRPGEKVNLLKLGEGPLPLPLGQDKADVHKMFEVKKAAPAKDDPANSIHLQLTPKKGGQFAKKLDAVDFWVDPQQVMPVRVQTTEGDQIKTWDLSNIQVNPNLADRDFQLEPVNEKEWQIDERPFDSP
jgi:outer membrane lipoprotein-sorting protein